MDYFFGYDDPAARSAQAASSGGGFFSSLGSSLTSAFGTALESRLTGYLGGGNGQDPKPHGAPYDRSGRPAANPLEGQTRATQYWDRKARERFSPHIGPGKYGRLPSSLEGIQPGGMPPREYDGKPRIPAWQWPLTYPDMAVSIVQEAMTLACQDYVTEDTLKKILRPINWKMAHQMAHDLREGSELADFLFKGSYGEDSPVDKSRGLAILQIVLQDIKPRRRRRRVVPKYVDRFFDKLKDMKKVVSKFYGPSGEMKRPARRRKKR